MLEKLTIRNYALIDSLELDFHDGLTILTGETGAGKSIMLGALSLLLGGRADTRVISDGGSKSIVEALFTGIDDGLKEYFDRNDLEWNGGEAIVRREIAQNGRSRAFINDRPVTLGILSQLAEQLIDIHSQHANARINDPQVQLEIIDVIADNESLRKDYLEEFAAYINLRSRIHRMRESIEKAKENSEFMRFQLEQLNKLNPKKGELEQIEARFELLSDADEIKERMSAAASLIGGYDEGILDRLGEAKSLISGMDMRMFEGPDDADRREEDGEESAKEEERPPRMAERLDSAFIELKDIYETLSDYAASIESDPMALAKASSRMNAYYEAVKRFRVKNAEELVTLRDELSEKLLSIDEGDSELPELEKAYKAKGKVLKERADLLTASRHHAAEEFAALLNDTARPLGLKNMEFSVGFQLGKLSSSGQDRVEFLCAFNKNQSAGPVAKIASGGEISRLMLSMKRILASRMNLPTIIFDEVDTGVSGEIADKMGDMMVEMSRSMQVLTITHLPQVAAKGRSHFKVYKNDGAGRTITHVRELKEEERIREIAGMMSGSNVSDAALDNARALLRGDL
ncbi:MAG: DNA repair protein RecN [Muribaculaceae bacterium]|nr:DNA repair protein RecN [Muribaculaceae bacterium]